MSDLVYSDSREVRMNDFKPWKKIPDLTTEKLSAIADMIKEARH